MSATSTGDKWLDYEAAVEGQRQAALPDHSVWVAANAGSGKTKVLIDRVARLLLRGATPASILCVTYTKAAASEMQDRLFARLGSWCVMDEAQLRAELEKLEGEPPKDIGYARELFAQALETPGGLRIETIHAFCGRILRRFPLEAGVAPGFRELDDIDSAELWGQSVRSLGAKVGASSTLSEAAEVIASEVGGSGFASLEGPLKANLSDIAKFLRSVSSIDEACEIVFQRSGAGDETVAEIIGRVMGPDLPRDDLKLAIKAYSTGGKKDLDKVGYLTTVLSEAPAKERLETYERVFLTKERALQKSAYGKKVGENFPIVEELFGTGVPEGREVFRIGEVNKAIAARALYERSAALLRFSEVVFADFDRRKKARAGLDFDDLIQAVSSLLTDRNCSEWVLWKLDGGISHVLLDEAQDTSPHQWTILRALTDDIFAGAGVERDDPRTLFVVGDQKQSIYSFQGADPERFMAEARLFDQRAVAGDVNHHLPSVAMSFRSVPEVLNFVDTVFDADSFVDKAAFAEDPPTEADAMKHTAHRRTQAGCVDLWPVIPFSDEEEANPWDAPLDTTNQGSPRVVLANKIAQSIREALDDGQQIWDGDVMRPARPGDYLILVKGRTGGLFDAILQALKREHIPVAGADRIQLLDSLPVQDLLNLFRFVLCPEDDLTLAEILKGPFGGLDDDADLFALAQGREKGVSLWSRLEASREARHAPVKEFLRGLLDLRHVPPLEFLTAALDHPSSFDAPGWDLILSRFGPPAREPITALIDRAASFDSGSPPSLEMFLSTIERTGGEIKRELSGPQDEVRVMTVHGAKGLQAPIVILPDTTSKPKTSVDGLFVDDDGVPLWSSSKAADTPLTETERAKAEDANLRENRRLLYVALTRAQDRLVVCGAWHSKKDKKSPYAKDSWYDLCARGMNTLEGVGPYSTFDAVGLEGIRRYGEPSRGTGSASDEMEATARASEVLPKWLKRAAPVERDPERILAPSAISGGEPPVLAPFSAQREKSLRRGHLMHTLFEALPNLAVEDRRKAAKTFMDKQPEVTPAERKEMIDAVLGVLDDEVFADLFVEDARVEVPVIGRIGGNIISGRVDRLIVRKDDVLVVDYKTDRPAPVDVSRLAPSYRAQMAAYRHLLAGAYPNHNIRCFLVWTDGPQLMEIPALMLDEALNQLPA